MRFSSSLGIHYSTFAVVLTWLSPQLQTADWMGWMAGIMAASLVYMVGFIGGTAALGISSHFNDSSPFLRKLELTMAVLAAVVTAPMAILGGTVLMDGGFALSRTVQHASAAGLIFGTVMTFVAAYHLGVRQGPFFGEKPVRERRMPVTDWSLDRGDLRVAHFFATHMMQVTPFAALLAVWLFPEGTAYTAALTVTVVWGWLTVRSYRHALAARPVTSLLTRKRTPKKAQPAQ
ncbi:hypothetical protein [Litoreibacter roseus]|uniref:Uncharacterized protein n=1 Tax=Litoreibacter roseus TaxID=2601869 RepID=A0A6N6JNJ6_9RHOB|nr:hypothetical protein [Litoreibacter roseus]GFE67008.1 hypothetical protein KIN_40820 [Litoreibacter roseus]